MFQISEELLWELFVQAGPVGKLFQFDYSNLVHFDFIFFREVFMLFLILNVSLQLMFMFLKTE